MALPVCALIHLPVHVTRWCSHHSPIPPGRLLGSTSRLCSEGLARHHLFDKALITCFFGNISKEFGTRSNPSTEIDPFWKRIDLELLVFSRHCRFCLVSRQCTAQVDSTNRELHLVRKFLNMCLYIAIVLVTCWRQILVVYMVVEDSPLQAFGVPCSTKHFPGLGCTFLHLHPHWRLPKVYARSLCIQKIQAIHIQIGAHKRLWMNHDQVITVTLVDTVIISHIQTKIIMDLWQRLKSMRDVSPTAGSGWLAAPRNAPSCLCSFFWSCRHDLPRRWLEL